MAGPRQPASQEWFLCFKRLNSMPQRFKLFSQRLKYLLSGSLQKKFAGPCAKYQDIPSRGTAAPIG